MEPCTTTNSPDPPTNPVFTTQATTTLPKPTSTAPKSPPKPPKGVVVKKKYKPAHLKVKSIPTELPKHYRIERKIIGDPLEDMPPLDPNPPAFEPSGRYTQERKENIDKLHPDFLQPEERKLMHDFMSKQSEGFAWDDSERGQF